MNQNPNNAFLAGMAMALICVLLVGVIWLVVLIFFCLTLQRTQKEVRPRNRLIPAGLVWLHLIHLASIIPIAGYLIDLLVGVWDLIMVLKIAGSLKREFEDRGWGTGTEGFGRTVGITWAVCLMIEVPVSVAMNFIGPQMGQPEILLAVGAVFLMIWLTGIVLRIIYWVQMAGYGRRLRESYGGYGYRRGTVEEDYDDDYRPKRYRDDDYDRDDRPRRYRDDDFDRDDRKDRERIRDKEVDDEPLNFDRPTSQPRDDDEDDDRPG